MENYLNSIKNSCEAKNSLKITEKTLALFKFGKIASSILLTNAIIGFIVPKMNQAITKHYQKSINALSAQHPELMKNGVPFDEFATKDGKPSKDVSFGQGWTQTLLSLTHKFENEANYKLLSTDVGIAGGRAISARNKHERKEVLFRDVSSIYFYLFCRKHLNGLLNQVEDGRWTRLDPVSADQVHNHISAHVTNKMNGTCSQEEFLKEILGTKQENFSESVTEKIKKLKT